MNRHFLLAMLLLAALLLISCDVDSDDDDDDDDDNDNDAGDDDTGDDDDNDTGDAPDGPYESMLPSGKPLNDILGISSHISKSTGSSWTRDFEIEKLVAANVKLLRTDFKWDYFEAEDGVWKYDGYDVMVDMLLDNGIKVDALLDYGVDWAMPGGSHNEIDPADWADFTGGVAAHFADRIDIYEIWNEQNTARFWKPEPNPEHYGNLLRASYESIHENDPDAEVLFGGLSSGDDGMFGEYGIWSFLPEVFASHPDVCEFMDGMAIHPYTFIQQAMPEKTMDFGFFSFPSLEGAIDLAREHLTLAGCPDMPIHLTEIGWPDLLIGRNRQAPFIARGLMLSAAGGVDSFYWYTFWDGDGIRELPTEDAFGLFTWYGDDPQPKPTYKALVAVHELLGTSRFAGTLNEIDGWSEERRGIAFVDEEGTWTIGLWHTLDNLSEPVTITIPLHPEANGQWELYSQEGSLLTTGDTSIDKVEVQSYGWVQYLRFSTSQSLPKIK